MVVVVRGTEQNKAGYEGRAARGDSLAAGNKGRACREGGRWPCSQLPRRLRAVAQAGVFEEQPHRSVPSRDAHSRGQGCLQLREQLVECSTEKQEKARTTRCGTDGSHILMLLGQV